MCDTFSSPTYPDLSADPFTGRLILIAPIVLIHYSTIKLGCAICTGAVVCAKHACKWNVVPAPTALLPVPLLPETIRLYLPVSAIQPSLMTRFCVRFAHFKIIRFVVHSIPKAINTILAAESTLFSGA